MGHLRKGALEEMKKAMVWLLCVALLAGITACQNNNKKGAAYPQKEITMIQVNLILINMATKK